MNKEIKILLGFFIVIAVLGVLVNAAVSAPPSTQYANVAEVCMVDRDRDLVICRDSVGHIWEFYGSEDWEPGDCAALVMDDSGTELVIDDIIISARYCAWNLR